MFSIPNNPEVITTPKDVGILNALSDYTSLNYLDNIN